MKNNLLKKSVIVISLACFATGIITGIPSFAGSIEKSTPSGQLNMRVTRENFADYSDSLVLPDEKQKIKPDFLFFNNFNLLTGNFEYKDIFSASNSKFQPNALKALRQKQAEEEDNSISEPTGIYSISLEGQRQNQPIISLNSTPKTNTNNFMYSMIGTDSKDNKISKIEEYYNHALSLYKNNNLEDAEKYFLQVTELKPDFMYAFYNLGNIYYKKGDYYKALDYFNKAMDINPSNSDVCFNIAITLEILDHKTLAKKFYSKCLELNPSDKQAEIAIERLE